MCTKFKFQKYNSDKPNMVVNQMNQSYTDCTDIYLLCKLYNIRT